MKNGETVRIFNSLHPVIAEGEESAMLTAISKVKGDPAILQALEKEEKGYGRKSKV